MDRLPKATPFLYRQMATVGCIWTEKPPSLLAAPSHRHTEWHRHDSLVTHALKACTGRLSWLHTSIPGQARQETRHNPHAAPGPAGNIGTQKPAQRDSAHRRQHTTAMAWSHICKTANTPFLHLHHPTCARRSTNEVNSTSPGEKRSCGGAALHTWLAVH